MARRILILWAGRHRRRDWQTLYDDYRKRLSRDVKIDEQWIKVKGSSEDPGRRRAEGEAILSALPDPCFTVVLDERGRTLDSVAFANEIDRLRTEWPHPVAFVIGSDLGLDPAVSKAARLRLSLGPMTLGHELARLVLYEQLYRSFAIGKGIKYHRAEF
ncbi:MAG: 23S rRNA (pseudouridine(1915)-N(3))-methyltransferase RlmH [Acidobacteriota bacterium]